MSIWTHVVGAFRLDTIPPLNPNAKQQVEDILGPIATYENMQDVATRLPIGSEGSLRYHIHVYGEGLSWAVVTIWGDLRDFDSLDVIEAWWNNLLREFTDDKTRFLPLRDGCLTISCGDGQTKTLTYKPKE